MLVSFIVECNYDVIYIYRFDCQIDKSKLCKNNLVTDKTFPFGVQKVQT